LSAERLPFEDASVCGVEEKDCECDLRVPWLPRWSSKCLSCVVEDAAEMPEGGRGELTEVDDGGGCSADGRRRALLRCG
jgi:hypothetical protein